MNIYNKNQKRIGYIEAHEPTGNIIFNDGHKNILYRFKNYRIIFDLIEEQTDKKTVEFVKRHLQANSEKLKRIIDFDKNYAAKRKKQIDKDQLKLF